MGLFNFLFNAAFDGHYRRKEREAFEEAMRGCSKHGCRLVEVYKDGETMNSYGVSQVFSHYECPACRHEEIRERMAVQDVERKAREAKWAPPWKGP